MALDGLLKREGLRPPDVIKLEVEGAELAALQGARPEPGRRLQALLLVEIEEKNLVAAGASKAAIQVFLANFGYRPAHLRKGRWLPLDDVNDTQRPQHLLVRPRQPRHQEKARRVLNLESAS